MKLNSIPCLSAGKYNFIKKIFLILTFLHLTNCGSDSSDYSRQPLTAQDFIDRDPRRVQVEEKFENTDPSAAPESRTSLVGFESSPKILPKGINSFLEYCLNPGDANIKASIDFLKAYVDQNDCAAAEDLLRKTITKRKNSLLLKGNLISQKNEFGVTVHTAETPVLLDLRPLASFENLEKLTLTDHLFSKLNGLESLTQLSELNINSCPELSSLESIAGLRSLKKLVIKGTIIKRGKLAHIQALAQMTSLTHLDLRGNNLEDISPLANLLAIEDLDLSLNNISDLSPLSSLSNLIHLDLSNNKIADINALANLKNLKSYASQATNSEVFLNIKANPIEKNRNPESCPMDAESAAVAYFCSLSTNI